jgi:hypothetical protein
MGEQTTVLYAHRTPDGYRHFFPHPDGVRMCGDCFPIDRVRLTTDPVGSFWAWWDAGRAAHSMVFPHQLLVEICFPYGSKAEEDRGRGKLVRVRVERIEDLAPR